MIFYFEKQSRWYYRLLDESGNFMGGLQRRDGRCQWIYVFAGKQQRLHRNLVTSLKMLRPKARWFEQLTHFEEVK